MYLSDLKHALAFLTQRKFSVPVSGRWIIICLAASALVPPYAVECYWKYRLTNSLRRRCHVTLISIACTHVTVIKSLLNITISLTCKFRKNCLKFSNVVSVANREERKWSGKWSFWGRFVLHSAFSVSLNLVFIPARESAGIWGC